MDSLSMNFGSVSVNVRIIVAYSKLSANQIARIKTGHS
jgi:hypothetical protein